MKVYRLVPEKFRHTPFSSKGAAITGGRWNSPGVGCIYTSEHASLAQIEVMVHKNKACDLAEICLFSLDIDESLIVEPVVLPVDWYKQPPPKENLQLGDMWVRTEASLGLRVPSVVSPGEYNILLNDKHPAFAAALRTAKRIMFKFDTRLGH